MKNENQLHYFRFSSVLVLTISIQKNVQLAQKQAQIRADFQNFRKRVDIELGRKLLARSGR